ncbi:hypothetical protein CFE70_008798 [Pyrenophora teres f. teres 0-1]
MHYLIEPYVRKNKRLMLHRKKPTDVRMGLESLADSDHEAARPSADPSTAGPSLQHDILVVHLPRNHSP